MKNYKEALLILIEVINATTQYGEEMKGRISFLEGKHVETTLGTFSEILKIKIDYEDVEVMPILNKEFQMNEKFSLEDAYKETYKDFLQYIIFAKKCIFKDTSGHTRFFVPLKELLIDGFSY
ncbi:MAG: hypothetical protein PF569_00220 [Candidatus Woesearchaeota archaeon]|jgi:hypothetical protein|nr:hypothetical protein [Candidatus Woesearchaeota archaeon]